MPSYTIDRFEGDWAVLENEQAQTFTIPRTWLPAQAREGAVVNTFEMAESPSLKAIRLELDAAAADEQRRKATDRRDALPRGPKGDVSL